MIVFNSEGKDLNSTIYRKQMSVNTVYQFAAVSRIHSSFNMDFSLLKIIRTRGSHVCTKQMLILLAKALHIKYINRRANVFVKIPYRK